MANQISVSLDTNQRITIRTAPNGSLAAPLTWTLQSGDATVEPSADGSTCDIVSGTTATTAVVIPSDGVLNGEVDATITLAVNQATDLGLSADAPVAK